MSEVDEQIEETNLNSTRVIEDIKYCSICTLPYEYCSYGNKKKKCKALLLKTYKDIYMKLYPEENELENQEGEEGEGEEEIEKISKDVKSININSKKNKSESDEGIITIQRNDRSKKKRTTDIKGLVYYQIDLKKAAKIFANKFACGSSVTKNNLGIEDTITVQGDFQTELKDIILKNWSNINSDSIVLTEGKTK